MGLQFAKICYAPGKYAEHYYLCNYIPFRSGFDRLSRSLLRFKDCLADDLQAWVDCSASELNSIHIPGDVVVMRALSSKETFLARDSNTALDQLGRNISKAFHLKWRPRLIKKQHPTRPLKQLKAQEREAEIGQAFEVSRGYFNLSKKRILLIDDILTTGTTVSAVIRSVKRYFPDCRFKVFTLARASHENLVNPFLKLTGSDYKWKGSLGWAAAEEKVVYDENNYKLLIHRILNDDFGVSSTKQFSSE